MRKYGKKQIVLVITALVVLVLSGLSIYSTVEVNRNPSTRLPLTTAGRSLKVADAIRGLPRLSVSSLTSGNVAATRSIACVPGDSAGAEF